MPASACGLLSTWPMHVNTFMRRGELESCARVTRLISSKNPAAGERYYEGILLFDLRIGGRLVLFLAGRRRLITSTIERVEPIGPGVVEVETSNNRYSVHRMIFQSMNSSSG
jgi:hypothetical protein